MNDKSIVYHYDFNGCYLGSSSALIDPLETARRGENVYLLPSNGTNLPLPEIELCANQIFQFNGSSWNVAISYLGKIAYEQSLPYRQERIEYIGELREGWSLTQPEIVI